MSLRLWIQPAVPAGARTPIPSHVVEFDLAIEGVFLGRGKDCAIALPYPDISVTHARLFQQDGFIYLEDLGSSNGTWVGDRRLTPHLPLAVGLGEPLRLASVRLRVESSGAGIARVEDGAEGTETLARRLVADLFCACPPAEPATLSVEAGPDVGKALPLLVSGRRYMVGRGPACDLLLSDPDVSREHVAVVRSEDGIRCEDLGSKNGAFVGDDRIVGFHFVGDGQLLKVGSTAIRVLDPEDRYLRKMQEADAIAKEAAAKEAEAQKSLAAPVESESAPTSPGLDPESDPEFRQPLRTPELEPVSPPVSDPSLPDGSDYPNPAPSKSEKPKKRTRSLLPYVVGAVAGSVILGILALVVALAFGAWK